LSIDWVFAVRTVEWWRDLWERETKVTQPIFRVCWNYARGPCNRPVKRERIQRKENVSYTFEQWWEFRRETGPWCYIKWFIPFFPDLAPRPVC
jgi:hypothetical protein